MGSHPIWALSRLFNQTMVQVLSDHNGYFGFVAHGNHSPAPADNNAAAKYTENDSVYPVATSPTDPPPLHALPPLGLRPLVCCSPPSLQLCHAGIREHWWLVGIVRCGYSCTMSVQVPPPSNDRYRAYSFLPHPAPHASLPPWPSLPPHPLCTTYIVKSLDICGESSSPWLLLVTVDTLLTHAKHPTKHLPNTLPIKRLPVTYGW